MEKDKKYRDLELKYWEGETNLIEESALETAIQEYPELFSEDLKSVFQARKAMNSLKLDDEFDSEFWKKAEGESNSGVFAFSDFMRYAAVGIIIIGLGYSLSLLMHNDQTTIQTEVAEISSTNDTYESPEVAFEKAKQALLMASGNLNKGQEKMEEIKRFHHAKATIMGGTEKE